MTQAHLDYSTLIRKVKLKLSDGTKIHVYAEKIVMKPTKKNKIKRISISKSLWKTLESNRIKISSALQLTSL
jgi:hypothetical protein